MFRESPWVNNQRLANIVDTACFMDVPAYYNIGLKILYEFPNGFAPDMETEKDFVEFGFVGRSMTDK